MFLSIEVLGEAVSEAGIYNQNRYFLPDGIVNVYMLYISTCNLKSYKPFPFRSSRWLQNIIAWFSYASSKF